jgi:hypothetical protein
VVRPPDTIPSAPLARQSWCDPPVPNPDQHQHIRHYELHLICSSCFSSNILRECVHLFPASERRLRVGIRNGALRTKLYLNSSVIWHRLLAWWKLAMHLGVVMLVRVPRATRGCIGQDLENTASPEMLPCCRAARARLSNMHPFGNSSTQRRQCTVTSGLQKLS